MSGTLPTVITAAGLQPQTPASLNAQLIAIAVSLSPGLTANLPGSLIEDISSTDTGALVLIDQARVDAVNSLTPYGANAFTLLELGQIYLGQGSTASPASNASVFVQFTTSPSAPGFVIPPGFIVSDGTNQFTVQDGGVIESDGLSALLFCLATNSGTFSIPAGTVTQLVTSAPTSLGLTVTNPSAGTPASDPQTESDYRSQVLQAGLSASTGMLRFLKTKLQDVPGVQSRLISVIQSGSSWEIIVGGNGDPYAIGYAILVGLFDVLDLVGSSILVTGITNANPGVVTTNLNHGYASGQVINIAGVVGMSGVNNTPLTITVITEKTFSIGINTTGSGTWTSGGVVTPNFRNITVNINDYPDIYTIPFVNPPPQTVSMTLTWNTIATNFVSPASVAALGQPAIAAYVNSIQVGAPINLFELQETFTASIASIVPPALLTRMVFTVSINGVVTAPNVGTGIIAGDPESYFSCAQSDITITQG